MTYGHSMPGLPKKAASMVFFELQNFIFCLVPFIVVLSYRYRFITLRYYYNTLLRYYFYYTTLF